MCSTSYRIKSETLYYQISQQAQYLNQQKVEHSIWGYDCDDMPTLDALTEFFATQGLPAALTASTRRDYDSDWRGWVTFCVVMRKPEAVLPAEKQVLMAFMYN